MSTVFRLAGLLRVRGIEADAKAAAATAAQRRLQRAEARRAGIHRFLADDAGSAPIDAASLAAIAASRASAAGMMAALGGAVAEASEEREHAERERTQALREVRVVEKLEARHRVAHRHRAAAAQQAHADEIVAAHRARRDGMRATEELR